MTATASAQKTGGVKSRLLPLSVFENILEALVELLPRQNTRVDIVPEKDVTTLSYDKGEYRAESGTPRFRMVMSLAAAPGWYYLEAAVMPNTGSRDAHIEVIIAESEFKIPIPTNLRGSVREVFFLPQGVTHLYWTPTTAPGFFSQSPLLIHKIGAAESFFRRAHRVIFDLCRFRQRVPAARAGLSWGGAFSNLSDAYERTRNLRVKRLAGNDYTTFIEVHDTLRKVDVKAMKQRLSKWRSRPLFSLLMPLRSAESDLLRASIQALTDQIYVDWELLVVATCPAASSILETVRTFALKDQRIRIIDLSAGDALDADIARVLNAGLGVARGEFVAQLCPHDRLPMHALYCFAEEFKNHPDTNFIYSDDDEIDSRNQRLNPRFKPKWNPDLLMSHNYIGAMSFLRRSLLEKNGGYREGFEGAEDYDLLLRCLQDFSSRSVRHISKVLCHRHTKISNERRSCRQSGFRALQEYLGAFGATVEDGARPCLYRVRYPIPAETPLVSIIVPTRDKLEVLRPCIESIVGKTTYPNWELLVIDNNSTDRETLQYFSLIQENPRIRVVRYAQPFNYSAINNFAVGVAKGAILALVNNDIEVITPDWLSEMVGHALRPEVGAVGAKLLYSNGTVQHAGVIVGLGGVAGHGHRFIGGDDEGYCYRAVVTQGMTAVTGACLVVRRSDYLAVGGLDEKNLAVAFNDVDFCLELVRLGRRNIYTPHAKLFHHESISRGRDDTPEKQEIFAREFDYMKKKWAGRLKSDEAYNSNLSYDNEGFHLA